MAIRYVDRIGQQLDSVAGGTTTVTTTVAAQVGDFLVLASRCGQAGVVSSISDSAGNSWTKLNNSQALQTTMSVWYCTVTSALATSSTITVSYSVATSGNRNVAVWLFGGINKPSTTNATAQVGATGTTLTVGNVTPQQYGSLLFAAVGSNQSTTHTASSGWTALPISTSNVFMGAAYAISSMSSLGTTWTIGATGAMGAVSATLTPDGGDFLALL